MKCKYCGIEFVPRTPMQHYCSWQCRFFLENRKFIEKHPKKEDHKWDIVQEIEEYKKKTGKYVSYGKYVSMKERGYK